MATKSTRGSIFTARGNNGLTGLGEEILFELAPQSDDENGPVPTVVDFTAEEGIASYLAFVKNSN